jgi:hypothetical protein
MAKHRKTRQMTLEMARDALAEFGMVIKKADDEYRVNFKNGSEDTAYYTDNIADAVMTGYAMSKKERCGDCGAIGERIGHQTCQYPQDY